MEYRLLAADIDGTLLRSDGTLSPATAEAILCARKAGLLFTLSTGRPIQGLKHFFHLLSPDVPVITYNGSMLLTWESRRVLYETGLDAADACRIYELGAALGTTVVAWGRNRLYAREVNDRVLDYRTMTGEVPIPVPTAADFAAAAAGGITKMLFLDEVSRIREIEASLGTAPGENVRYTTSKPQYLEFVAKNVSKSAALESACRHLGITRAETVTFGDGNNDRDMIAWAGLGVAMGNATPDVKAAAKYITGTNDEDGLASAIRRILDGTV